MNSEELEQSLRTEFESHLNDVFADMKQNVSGFQEKLEVEFEKYKSQVDEAFQDFSARFDDKKELDDIFKESVVEHLRLSRDEGARITATAFAEAEKLEEEQSEAASAGVKEILEAVNDISSKDSQSEILKTLVSHAEQFTPRGAFFIIKKEHLVGWRVFGREIPDDDGTVREVFFPVVSSTVLGESVRSLSAVESGFGNHSDDSMYLDKLDFGHPANMYAVPLVVRGRSVAVLYADGGSENGAVNIEALETLVRVASLTVEILAGGSQDTSRYAVQKDESREETSENKFSDSDDYQSFEKADSAEQYEASDAKSENEAASDNDYQTKGENYSASEDYSPESYLTDSQTDEPDSSSSDEYSFEVQPSEENTFQPEEAEMNHYEMPQESEEQNYSWSQTAENSVDDDYSESHADEAQDSSQAYQFDAGLQTAEQTSSAYETESSPSDYSPNEVEDYQSEGNREGDSSQPQFEQSSQFESAEFDNSQYKSNESAQFESSESARFDAPQFQTTQADDFSTASGANPQQFDSYNQSFEAVAPQVEETAAVASPPVRSRFSDRNVDLPIEVGEEERRLHNDARRFARLLVSEIKLYNEQKVKEGRESNDLYERLREAIDRSREMYDKRVQPPVAARFDYFHYEVINTLAEGEEEKLGGSYPGAAL